MGELVPAMWGAAFSSGSDAALHLFSPDYTAVRRRQRGILQLEHAPQILLRIIGG
jgi:hypothetical protein